VYHLKYSLCLFTLHKENTGLHCTHGCATSSTAYVCLLYKKKTLRYTALMGVSPKVQPMFVYSTKRKNWVTLHSWVCHQKYSLCLFTLHKENTGSHFTHGRATKSTAYVCLLYKKKTLGYTALTQTSCDFQPQPAKWKVNLSFWF